MKNSILFAALFLAFLMFLGCNSSQSTLSTPEDSALILGELITQSIVHNYEEREYLIYVPNSYNENTNHPVLLNFHEFGGNAKDYIEYESDFREIAEREEMILIYPQALLFSGFSVWNADPFAEENITSSDDIGFVEIILDNLKETLSIDPNRIYATGFSNGAMFAYALACFTEGLIAGVAAVSGLQLNFEDCAPSHPMSVLIAHSTTNDVIPYGGSSDVASVNETVLFWTSVNQTATVAEESNLDLGDETVWLYNYPNGTNGAQVLHYKVENGKHEWFEHNLAGQSFTSFIWDFLSPQTLNGRED
jgi:polyhydroxybutyrate depolymerase